MKLWVITRPMLNYPNYHRIIFINTLRSKCWNSIFICSTHFTRRKLRMIITIYSRKRSINILSLYLSSYRSRNLLWILLSYRNMKPWSNFIYSSNSNSFYRICPPMRTNKILRCHCYYKLIFSNSIYRENISRMIMRRVCSR